MYNEEEINDSLEFCHDIDTYYEKRDAKASHGACIQENVSNEKYFRKKNSAGKYSKGRFSNENGSLGGQRAGSDFSGRSSDTGWNSREYGEESQETSEKNSIVYHILNGLAFLVMLLFLSYGISSFLSNYCIWNTKVDGISMEPALEDGDRLIIDRLSYRFHEPERFDVVVFPQELDVYYVKRIIGLPGETVQIIDGKIYVNDIILAENYGNEPMNESYSMEEAVTLGEDEYFVLGDNRNYSIDSRDPSVGMVTRKHIMGKVWVILYPFENMRFF